MSDRIEPPLCTTSTQVIASSEALFYWSVQGDDHGIFIMNDMDTQTGCLPLLFMSKDFD